MLRFFYDISAARVLDDALFAHSVDMMHRAHVQTVFINSYFYGKWETSSEKVYQAALRLRAEGFEAEILHVPFGHGGNALDPDNHEIPLVNGKGWRCRMDSAGRVLPTTTCVNDACIRDMRAVNDELSQMGFHKMMLDDDCRLGMWGSALQGCFCDDCMARFAARTGKIFTRAEIINGDPALRDEWMDFQCENLVRYLVAIKPEKMQLGVMVMHNGDRRHGIDIKKIRQAIPNAYFRVGEAHFRDCDMTVPNAEESIETSIHNHMALCGGAAHCCSESTVFPMGELSPENWLRKMRLEIDAGLRTLYLMSGTRFFTDDYWNALATALPELEERSETPEPPHPIKPFVW